MQAEIEGEIVGGRPFVEVGILVNGRVQPLRCQIDCDDEMVFNSFSNAEGIGLRFNRLPRASRRVRYLANGTRAYFVEARATLQWFGERTIRVLAPDPLAPTPDSGSDMPNPNLQQTEPHRVLIGSELLINCQVLMTFLPSGGTVIIRPIAELRAATA